MTRQVELMQYQLGELPIGDIQLSLKSRDDIPCILRGLQYIYTTPELRKAVFSLLEEKVAPNVSHKNGRPGLGLWKILVMGVLRLDLNCDYDRLLELVNQHRTIRQMLGEPSGFSEPEYQLQTLKDNVRLLTPQLLESLNELIVNAGHELVKKKDSDILRGRCDSFVVETDVHFPTDITLLYDALRKVIQLIAQLSERHGSSEWRQYQYNIKQIKRAVRVAQQAKRGQANNPLRAQKKAEQLMAAHQDVLTLAQLQLNKAKKTLSRLDTTATLSLSDIALIEGIQTFVAHATRQSDQIRRRVLQGETIPSTEKVFSLFEPHTEWIMKGKAGTPVELGVRVCILEDQYQFILHHHVMEKQTDDQVAQIMVTQAKRRFPLLDTCSFDKGFHSPDNQNRLGEHLTVVAMPCKGKRSARVYEREHEAGFIKARNKHSAVESAINALEVHGLNRCSDEGIEGFKRYVALSIVTRNIHRIGTVLKQKAQCRQAREKRREAQWIDTVLKRAA